jgi:hypothetical protein
MPFKADRGLESRPLRARRISAPVPATATAAVTASAAIITTSTTAAISTTATPVPTTAAVSTTGPFFAGASFIDGQRPAFERFPVKLIYRILRFRIAPHGYEGEAARFAGELILDQQHFANRSGLRKEVLEIGLGGIERKVPHVKFGAHFGLSAFFSLPLSEGLR